MNRIPLLVPRMPLTDRLVPYLRQIDQNQWYTNFGPLNAEFERRLLADCGQGLGREHITTVSNCTVGLELALQALALQPGARVLIPSITFVATATAVLRVGLTPVLADIDPSTWVLTPQIARAAVEEGSIDAVMPVATFGYGHDANEWDRFTIETGVPVVIDAAGAYGNQLVGSTTDVVYSFHATKSFGAAEGGAVLSGVAARIATIRRLSNFGIDTSTGRLAEVGTNGKMSEYHCAIGLASFDEWDETRERRQDLHRAYSERLKRECPDLLHQQKHPDGIYPLMPVALPSGVDIEVVRTHLDGAGIETRRWYSPSLHTHPALSELPRASQLQCATDLGGRILGLPFFIQMTDEQMAHVCASVSDVLASCRGVDLA